MRTRSRSTYILGSLLLALFALSSCAGDAPAVKRDSGAQDMGGQYDGPVYYQDTGVKYDAPVTPDQYVWPDNQLPADTWPWPTDSYSGAPFGCKTDADCFGRVCCATPWGVKLCADSCNP